MYIPYSIKAEGFSRILKKLPSGLKLAGLKLFWPLYLDSIKRYKTPVLLTFYATNKCNSCCSHCYYHAALNQPQKELTLNEIKRIFSSFKHKIANILITGGEVFLREDIADICIFLDNQRKARVIDIATNGQEPETIYRNLKKILEKSSFSEIHPGISLDGFEQTHNMIRGAPGAYQKAMETIDRLKHLQKSHKNLYVVAVTTICDKNYREMPELIGFVKNRLQIRHSLSFIRSTKEDCFNNTLPLLDYFPRDPAYKNPPDEELEALNKFIGKNDCIASLLGRLESLRREHTLRILREKSGIFPCVSSKIGATLYPNGDVAVCNFTRPLANLEEFNFDFYKLWNSPGFIKNRREVTNCACTWPRNLITSMCYDFDSVKKLVVD